MNKDKLLRYMIIKKTNRFELDKVKQYLAKLPFEDLTVAHFIPSYFLDNQKGKNIF